MLSANLGNTMADSPIRSSPGPLEEALDDDDNVLVPLRYPELRDEFLSSIEAQKASMEATVCLQLRVRWSRVYVRPRDLALREL